MTYIPPYIPAIAVAVAFLGLLITLRDFEIKYSAVVSIEPTSLAPIVNAPPIDGNVIWAALGLRVKNKGFSDAQNIKIGYEAGSLPCRDIFTDETPGMRIEPFDLKRGEEKFVPIGFQESLGCLAQYKEGKSHFKVALRYKYQGVLGRMVEISSEWATDDAGRFRKLE